MTKHLNHTQDPPLLYADDMKLAIFEINEHGPYVTIKDTVDWKLFENGNPEDNFINHLAAYSMVAINQGTNYTEGVHLLPVGKFTNYRAIVISILRDLTVLNIHEKYIQIVLIMPVDKLRYLPSPILIEKELVQITRTTIGMVRNLTIRNLMQVKVELLDFLNGIMTA